MGSSGLVFLIWVGKVIFGDMWVILVAMCHSKCTGGVRVVLWVRFVFRLIKVSSSRLHFSSVHMAHSKASSTESGLRSLNSVRILFLSPFIKFANKKSSDTFSNGETYCMK